MHGGMKVYRGAAAAARHYVEADRSRADDYYLAEGSGVAMRFVAGFDELNQQVRLERRVDMDGEAYERWVGGYDVETGAAKGRLRMDAKGVRCRVRPTTSRPRLRHDRLRHPGRNNDERARHHRRAHWSRVGVRRDDTRPREQRRPSRRREPRRRSASVDRGVQPRPRRPRPRPCRSARSAGSREVCARAKEIGGTTTGGSSAASAVAQPRPRDRLLNPPTLGRLRYQ